MGAAEVISFEEVRARKQWSTLRQQLHERFDRLCRKFCSRGA